MLDGGGAYFKQARKWLEERHGKENIVAISIHHDETTPHLVAYAVPIVTKPAHSRKMNVADGFDSEGKRKRKTITVERPEQKMLSAKHFWAVEKLSEMQTEFNKRWRENLAWNAGRKAAGPRIKRFNGFILKWCGWSSASNN